MVTPHLASVRPRVLSLETGEVALLTDVVESYADCNYGSVELLGVPGSGKTAALAHLAANDFANDNGICLLDEPSPVDVVMNARKQLVVYTTPQSFGVTTRKFSLAPWSTDDLIEYLLATAPQNCGSVMRRVLADDDRDLMQGSPALLTLVADELATNDEAVDIRTTLRRVIERQSLGQRTWEDAQIYCSAMLLNNQGLADRREGEMINRGVPRQYRSLLSSRFVQVLLGAERILTLIKGSSEFPFPMTLLPRSLINEVGRLAQFDPAAMARLRLLVKEGNANWMPGLASILHVAEPLWRPNHVRHLQRAFLAESNWQCVDLPNVILEGSDLHGSDLRDANLNSGRLDGANLNGIHGERVCLTNVRAENTKFHQANLSHANLCNGAFLGASFVGAILNYVSAQGSNFGNASFKGASLQNADLRDCVFLSASLEEVDLQGADLRGASFVGQNLHTALLFGANLENALLARCDMEFVDLPHANLQGADLTEAYLTGTKMVNGDFRDAKLNRAGLADVNWEDADLRSADLRECSFHMGSTRCGLVGSPYPGHGSRTGFYTNDYDAKSYTPPEMIRKANFCGADLRGALVDGADFYLVDLRGAKYDAQQLVHFRRCDAILGHLPT